MNKIETKEKENPEMKKVNNLLLNDSSIITLYKFYIKKYLKSNQIILIIH